MANPWALYQRSPSFVLGFHGTEKSLVDEVIAGKPTHLKKSDGNYEWLGHGVYFWENDPQRGLEWANSGNTKKKIEKPAVVGAVIDLGLCLDLTTRMGLDEVAEAYATLHDTYAKAGLPLPINTGGKDQFKRELDCQVIQALHQYRQENGQPPYDSVRAPFQEADPLYGASRPCPLVCWPWRKAWPLPRSTRLSMPDCCKKFTTNACSYFTRPSTPCALETRIRWPNSTTSWQPISIPSMPSISAPT